MDKLREEVISNIRACLISTKGSLDIRSLRRDYHMLMGEHIPHSKLGYNTLDDFVRSIDSLRTSRGPNGELIVDAKVTKATSHIASMVAKQKTKQRRTNTRPHPPRYQMNQHRYARPAPQHWRPTNVGTRLSTPYQSSPRPAAVAHSQFVWHPNTPQKRFFPPRYQQQQPPSRPQTQETAPPPPVTRRIVYNTLTTNEHHSMNIAGLRVDSDSSSTDGNGYERKAAMARIVESPLFKSKDFSKLHSESMAAIDPNSPLWDHWTSSDEGSPRKNGSTREFETTGDSFVDLCRFVEYHRLPEVQVKFTDRRPKRKGIIYDCKVTIGRESFSSYPGEFSDKELARQRASAVALADLMKQHGRKRNRFCSTEKDVLERIPPMVEKHANGVWNMQLEDDYVDMFQELLPSDWLGIVATSPLIYVQTQPLMENRAILRYRRPGEAFQNVPSHSGALTSGVSVPTSTVSFDENGLLNAVVTCVVSAAEIWCRQLDTAEAVAFDRMMTTLETYYEANAKSLRAKNVVSGGYYVTKCENMWFRVRVTSRDDDDENVVNCFTIDCGDELTRTVDDVCTLKRQFAVEQAQAFVCRLAGLEDLYEASQRSESLQELLWEEVQLERIVDDVVTVTGTPSDQVPAVLIVNLKTGQNENRRLMSTITMESAMPELNEKSVTEVYVSHIEENGDVYVQVHSPGFEKLTDLLHQLEETVVSDGSIATTPITPQNSADERLFFVRFEPDGHYYRARVYDWAPTFKHAQLYYVDYGNATIVDCEKEKAYALDRLSDVASLYPHQAVKVHLAIPKVSGDFLEQAKALLPYDEPVTLKWQDRGADGVPIVELFKRSRTDDYLFSVNKAIEMKSMCGVGENNNTPSKTTKLVQKLISSNQFNDIPITKNVPSTGSLAPPPMPKIGEYFEVKIPCAVSPSNFIIQPRKQNKALCKMMAVLQERYKDVTYSPLTMDDIHVGQIYASRHEDGRWYRTSVNKVIDAGSILVFYCDFGYYASLSQQQLIPLDLELMELPYQAVKAKLAGIRPKREKWTIKDCLYFQDLVCKKAFQMVLISEELDELYKCDKVLVLKLIDTSTEDDVYIDKVLMEKGIARAVKDN